MTQDELGLIIANNISLLLEKRGKSQSELADYMDVSQATVSNWVKGIKQPRMDKIDDICKFFNVTRSTLFGTDSYWLDNETAQKAQEIYEDPDTRILLDAKRDLSADDLDVVLNMIKALKEKEGK